ncbi:unnamed protein product [Brassica oleracea]
MIQKNAKRKEEYADLPDITSTSKKLCTSIKVEKEKEELFEAMEGRNVPPKTHSLYQQISML